MANKRQIIIISLITAACLLGDSMLYIAMPVHYKEMGLTSLWEVGLLLSVNRLVRLPLNPLIGWLYQKIHIRTGIMIAVVLTFVTTSSYSLLHQFWLLFIMRSVWGAAWTLLRLGAYFTILQTSTPTTRGSLMGTYNGLFRLGSLFGMLLGGMIADLYGVDAAAVSFAIAALAVLPFTAFLCPTSIPASANYRLIDGSVPYWKSPGIWWTLASGMIIAMLYQGMFTATLSHFIEGYNPGNYVIWGWTLGAASLAGILQAVRWVWEPFLAPWFGRLSDRTGSSRKLFVLTLLLAAVLFAIVSVHMPLWLWLLILLGIQLTATILTTVMDALAVDAATRQQKAAAMTSYSVATDLGAALGPTLGYLSDSAIGTRCLYMTAAALLLAMAIRWYRPWKESEPA
ncbi:MFS transporter [Ferviditalea candida]|uniref:MFS transporter n=1 Tax=Ferviditalea candida TaxID=3108399 RepID=A0ABU5ZMY4_9BACL|nr:MFS transporter [Paenibacillaceae bacterium T2]